MTPFAFGQILGVTKQADLAQAAARFAGNAMLGHPGTLAGAHAALGAPIGAALGAYNAPKGQKLYGAGRGAVTGAAAGAGAGLGVSAGMHAIGGFDGIVGRAFQGGLKNNLINQIPNAASVAGGVAGYQLAKQRPQPATAKAASTLTATKPMASQLIRRPDIVMPGAKRFAGGAAQEAASAAVKAIPGQMSRYLLPTAGGVSGAMQNAYESEKGKKLEGALRGGAAGVLQGVGVAKGHQLGVRTAKGINKGLLSQLIGSGIGMNLGGAVSQDIGNALFNPQKTHAAQPKVAAIVQPPGQFNPLAMNMNQAGAAGIVNPNQKPKMPFGAGQQNQKFNLGGGKDMLSQGMGAIQTGIEKLKNTAMPVNNIIARPPQGPQPGVAY